MAGIIHSLTLLAIILAAAPLARDVPLATLGAILLAVAYNMGEWHEFVRLRHFSNHYRIILFGDLRSHGRDRSYGGSGDPGLVFPFFFFVTRVSSLHAA